MCFVLAMRICWFFLGLWSGFWRFLDMWVWVCAWFWFDLCVCDFLVALAKFWVFRIFIGVMLWLLGSLWNWFWLGVKVCHGWILWVVFGCQESARNVEKVLIHLSINIFYDVDFFIFKFVDMDFLISFLATCALIAQVLYHVCIFL